MGSLLSRIAWRLLVIGVTLAAGLFVLGWVGVGQAHTGAAPQVTSAPPPPSTGPIPVQLDGTRSEAKGNDLGYGAGDDAAGSRQAAFCNPLDVSCLAQAALSAILTPVTQTLTAFCDAVLGNIAAALSGPASPSAMRVATSPTISPSSNAPVGQGQGAGAAAALSFNFLTQTPLCFSTLYSPCAPTALDGAIAPLSAWTQMVAFSALSLLLVVSGLGISLGQQAGWRVQGVAELLPRLVLTFLAAWMAPAIVQVAIDLNNLLCQGALQTTPIGTLATQIGNLANPAVPTSNLLVLLFLLAATVMAILLIGQMALRLAFVALLGALAPLGLFCFGLPLTSGWGRLWTQQFSLAVFLQFVQVAALALGGALLVALSAPTTALFAGVPDATPIVESLLLIMLFYLAFRLPAMMQASALRHAVTEVNQATVQILEGAGEALALLVA